MSKFYVYEHWRPDKNEPIYVGKGVWERVSRTDRKHNSRHQNIRMKLKELGLKIEVRIILETDDESEAFRVEVERIAHWRGLGFRLCNATDGGEGASGAKHTPEWKAAMSRMNRGRKMPPEHMERLREISTGRIHTPEARAKMSRSRMGKMRTEDEKRKISETLTGYKRNPEEIEKSASKRRVPVLCIDDGMIFKSVTDAAEFYGATRSRIAACCNGTRRTASHRRFAWA